MTTPKPISYVSSEFKLMSVREIAMDYIADTPAQIYRAWKEQVETASWYSPVQECFVVFLLNTRRRLIGFKLVSIGTLNETQAHPRDVFSPAILGGAHSVVVAHNHPSGDPTPSESDVKTTRNLMDCGKLLRIELADHVIVGIATPERTKAWQSLRELGYLY